MVAENKLFDFYRRAKDAGHPDPDRGILGRAQLSGLSSEFAKGDNIGLFGIAEKKASKLGWSDLDNAENNYQAMLELDQTGFQKSNKDTNEMFMFTAGTTRDAYLKNLDNATAEIKDKIIWDHGNPIGFKDPEPKTEELLESTDSQVELEDQTRQVAAELKTGMEMRIGSDSAPLDLTADLQRMSQLLKEYIDATVE